MTIRGYQIRGGIYCFAAGASLVMLVTGILDWPIAALQTAVFPVLAWMNFGRAGKTTSCKHGVALSRMRCLSCAATKEGP